MAVSEDAAPGRTARKHQAILEAATEAFLANGYSGTSMDEIAAAAGVSKQTVYKHFADKERLFSAIVLSTTDRVERVVRLIAGALTETRDLERDLTELARRFTVALMDPELLRLRRLVIASADRFPQLGRSWYENGFERVLATLASSFERLAKQRLLQLDDARAAAEHFVGMLLWIPVNQAMFTGDHRALGKAELERRVRNAVRAFVAAYGPTRRR